MREILFRGKDEATGKWVEGDLLHGRDGGLLIVRWNVFQARPETVGQYTGLDDKNGKKIFEGDIVEYAVGNVGVVKYSDHFLA